jgi:hypothetical protein
MDCGAGHCKESCDPLGRILDERDLSIVWQRFSVRFFRSGKSSVHFVHS